MLQPVEELVPLRLSGQAKTAHCHASSCSESEQRARPVPLFFSFLVERRGAGSEPVPTVGRTIRLAAATTEAQTSAFRSMPHFTVKRPHGNPEGGKKFQASLLAANGAFQRRGMFRRLPAMPDMPSFARETGPDSARPKGGAEDPLIPFLPWHGRRGGQLIHAARQAGKSPGCGGWNCNGKDPYHFGT